MLKRICLTLIIVVSLVVLTQPTAAYQVISAPATTYDCEGSTSTYLCASTDYEQRWGSFTCTDCKTKTHQGIIDVRYCNVCGAQIHWEIHADSTWTHYCEPNGQDVTTTQSARVKEGLSHKYLPTPCEHNQTDPHTYIGAPFCETVYGYKGDSNIFYAYDLVVQGCSISNIATDNYSSTLAHDGAIEGAKVTISLPSNTTYLISINEVTTEVTASTYTFTMPAQDTTVVAKQYQYITVSTLYTEIYNSPTFNLNAQVTA